MRYRQPLSLIVRCQSYCNRCRRGQSPVCPGMCLRTAAVCSPTTTTCIFNSNISSTHLSWSVNCSCKSQLWSLSVDLPDLSALLGYSVCTRIHQCLLTALTHADACTSLHECERSNAYGPVQNSRSDEGSDRGQGGCESSSSTSEQSSPKAARIASSTGATISLFSWDPAYVCCATLHRLVASLFKWNKHEHYKWSNLQSQSP